MSGATLSEESETNIHPSEVDLFTEPVCLIDTDDTGKLKVDDNVVAALQTKLDDRRHLVVIAIAGLYRTGKSYIMNRLAGKSSGKFSVECT